MRTDTFTRINTTGGWGTASDGNAWTLISGASSSGGSLGISSNRGTLASTTASLFNVLGGTVNDANQEGLVRWSVDSTSATVGILLRAQSSSNYYLGRYSGGNSIQFLKKVAGLATTVGSVAFTPTVGKLYWLRFRAQGNGIFIKVWADGTAEPLAWTYTTTDNSLSLPGYVGLYGYASNSTANTFDSFSVTGL